MKDQDSVFFRNFSMLLGFLIFLTIVLAFTGYFMQKDILGDNEMAKDRSEIAKTLEPVAKVNTGDVIVPQVEEEKAPTAAFDGTLDGKKIYDNVCTACHSSGAAGAPKLEKAAWEPRLANGIDALVASAIKGKGAMPPRGGRADLSDEQVKATVEFMTAGF